MAKRSGDNYPTDIKGSMICVGMIVVVPVEVETNTQIAYERVLQQQQRLGYVKKITQKRGIDVVIFHSLSDKQSVRYTNPSQQLCTIDISTLKERDPLHEAIRMAARGAVE